jgi:hypothetical protein
MNVAEKPIKLFGTRADRYPEAEDSDAAAAVLRAALEDIPGIKTVIKFLDVFVQPELTRRQIEWLKDFSDDFDRVKEQFNPEVLGKNEAFVSMFVRATRIAAGTHQEEKRRMLRNALLNIVTREAPSDDLQQVFFNAIDEFTPSHVKVLKVLWTGEQELIRNGRFSGIGTYEHLIEKFIPDLKNQQSLTQCIITDLRNRGFTTLSSADASFEPASKITNLGIDFVQFVSTSEGMS